MTNLRRALHGGMFVLLVSVFAGGVSAGDLMADAKKFFADYVARVNSFDPAVVDLYADDARIENTRQFPDGTRKSVVVPAAKYKEMLKSALPAAKEKHDTSDFLAVDYKIVGERVHISATRFSNAKGEATPITYVVGPGPAGKWLIFEELSESRT